MPRAIRLLEGAETAAGTADCDPKGAHSDPESGDIGETATNVVAFPKHHE